MDWIFYFKMAVVCMVFVTAASLGAKGQEVPYDELKVFRLLQNQDYKGATDYLVPFYERDSTNLDVLAQLAYSHRLSNNLTEATWFYRQSFRIDSANVGVLSNLGNLSIQRFNYHLAEDYFRRIIAIDPNHVHANISLSTIMGRKSEWDQAYAHLAHAYAHQPRDIDLAADLVRMCMEQEQYERADSLLRETLPKDPDNGRLLYARVEVSEHLEQYMEMVRTCEHIIALGAQSVPVLRQYARGLFALKDYTGCLEQFEAIIAADGSLGELDYYYMAMSAKTMKRYKEALAYMDMALEAAISPNAGFYYGRKADLYKLANQPSNAIKTYQKSFHFSVVPIHYYEMGIIYERDLTNLAQAARHFELFLKQELTEADEPYANYARHRIRELK